MINLRKPLEGIPGLLLMAALVLFGATIGVTAALALSWVDMKDSIANFLGGVVGAGLGAALAVLGAVYVQRRDARERLSVPINRLRLASFDLHMLVGSLSFHLEGMSMDGDDSDDPRRNVIDILRKIDAALETLPEGAELPAHVHRQLQLIKRVLPALLKPVSDHVFYGAPQGGTPNTYEEATEAVRSVVHNVDELYELAKGL